jgi:hypothetical protein
MAVTNDSDGGLGSISGSRGPCVARLEHAASWQSSMVDIIPYSVVKKIRIITTGRVVYYDYRLAHSD